MANSVIKRMLNMNDRENIHFTVGFENQSFSHPEGTGCWYVSNVGAGSPTGSAVWGILIQVRSPFRLHPTARDAFYSQMFFNSDGRVFSRILNNYSWTAWRTL